jgi:hypothetical protein
MLAGDRHGRPHPGIHRPRQGQERSVPPDGLRPPRLQELRSARQDHAEDLPRGAGELGIKDDPLLEVAMELERIALTDEYFIEKKLYPNIDFYSGITLKAMGFPTTMFTVLFALARTVGWIAQWKEMIEDPQQKIGRPRQLYTGASDLAPKINPVVPGARYPGPEYAVHIVPACQASPAEQLRRHPRNMQKPVIECIDEHP